MNNTVVIYHRADFDGIFSREIARRFFDTNANYIGWDYGDPVPQIPEGVDLYMIDISVEPLMLFPGLRWIDHHKSAIEKYPVSIAGYRIDGVAACRLAWQWFFSGEGPMNPLRHFADVRLPKREDYVQRHVIEPLAVRLAGEYDVWDKRDPNAELFQHGLRSCEPDFDRLLMGNEVSPASPYLASLLKAGEALQFARVRENESVIKRQGFTIQWEGLTFLCCNSARYNSHLFTAGLLPEHDGCLGFNWDGGKRKWRISLYGVPGKPDLDLSQIAVRFGGGGHRQACGFECAHLPFPLTGGAS